MTGNAGIMDRLKAETAGLHRHAESRPLQQQLASGTLARQAFAAYMGQLLLVHDRLEQCLDDQVHRNTHSAYRVAWQGLARHSANLRDDLAAHGLEPDAVNALDATAALLAQLDEWSEQGSLSLLGALYVLEGSMNGNRYISKALHHAWGPKSRGGLSYLDPYGEAQRPTWMEFRNRVNALAFDDEESTAILAGADRMFKAIAEISDEQHRALLV